MTIKMISDFAVSTLMTTIKKTKKNFINYKWNWNQDVRFLNVIFETVVAPALFGGTYSVGVIFGEYVL